MPQGRHLTYRTGELPDTGDDLRWDGISAVLIDLHYPGTENVRGYQCFKSGGILIKTIHDNELYLLHPHDDRWKGRELRDIRRTSTRRCSSMPGNDRGFP